ncbi:hypothetical protein BS627_18230 [Agrobacterium salinitolerans]|uniref:hypothetical protein n=1 Tax=Agrobacterium salinitolerans TaxID=1183413 RepID=UPI00098FCE32|nr:hypothetical protein [Agrobacterium salinitolerans]OOO18462.1 hypothetical protein BS627_18230 [Agrobacterium salinitolerans]PNQ21685.1 hypothetical protein C2E26_18540 [Rhizobium sp. YIC5082]
MTKKEEAPVTRRFLPFRLLIAKTKRPGKPDLSIRFPSMPVHPWSKRSTVMFQSASTFMAAAFHHQDRLLRLIFG